MPGISGVVHITTNHLGLRAPAEDPAASDVKVLCVGGSTTECDLRNCSSRRRNSSAGMYCEPFHKCSSVIEIP